MHIYSTRLWLGLLLVLVLLASGCLGSSFTTSTYSIQGRVTDANGNGMADMTIEVVYQNNMTTVDTDAQGKYELAGLKGIAEVKGPLITGMRSLPAARKVTAAESQVDFVLHPVQVYGQDVTLPESKIVVYDQIVFDFSQTTLTTADTVVVTAAAVEPLEGMSVSGSVVNIEVSSSFSAPAVVAFLTNEQGSTLFRYNEAEEIWYPVIGSIYADGMIHAELPSFSTYGVFTAPRAPKPEATPEPGIYLAGSTIQLFGDEIYYTTDGSMPMESDLYDDFHQILLPQEGLLINAINVKANHAPSELEVFVYEADGSELLVNVSGPRFVTLSGNGVYFDFDSGDVTTDTDEADIRLTAQQYGSEFIMIRLANFSGTWFRSDQEGAYDYFRTVTEADWIEVDPGEMGNLAINDMILLKTSEGRFVKLFVIDIRGHWQHQDAPAVDFAYLFTNEIDLEPPRIEQVILVTESGIEITQPITDRIEFTSTDKPVRLRLELNEIAYGNRGLKEQAEGLPFSSAWWCYADPSYYQRPNLSDQFAGSIGDMDEYTPQVETIILTAGDDDFYANRPGFVDEGYFFSDLLGNQLTELPFTEIVITYERD